MFSISNLGAGTWLESATVVASNAEENAAWALYFQFDSGHAYQLTFRHGLDGAPVGLIEKLQAEFFATA